MATPSDVIFFKDSVKLTGLDAQDWGFSNIMLGMFDHHLEGKQIGLPIQMLLKKCSDIVKKGPYNASQVTLARKDLQKWVDVMGSGLSMEIGNE